MRSKANIRRQASTLENTSTFKYIISHHKDVCKGQVCCLHNRSEHHMRGWPQNWREDRGIMERICEHGVGHPDPDDISVDKVHGCDGCCSK